MPSWSAVPPRWIVSRSQDLIWFQGSALAGLALLAVFLIVPGVDDTSYGLGHPALLVVFLWGVLFDGTHVWGTYARSYCAPDEASRAALPGRWSWGLLAIGPALAFFDDAVFGVFLVAAYLWAYWHLVRQHYGFLMLYRKRAGEHDPRAARLDSVLLWSGCLYPYLRFALTEAYQRTGLPQPIPPSLLAPARLALDVAVVGTMGAALVLVLSERFEPFRLGPKHLLLGIVVVFHLAVFSLLEHLLAILATLTIFHNLQYHRIVWQYERGLGRIPSGGLGRYLGLGLGLGLLWYAPRVLGVAVASSEIARNVLVGLGWGVAFHHYVVDGRIWRVRRSATVARALDAGAVS